MIGTKVVLLAGVMVWSACGGAMLVNQIHADRGVLILKEVQYAPNPFAAEVEKYAPLMEKLLVAPKRSQPDKVSRSPEVRQVKNQAPVPRARPSQSKSSRTIKDVIALAEAGL